MIKPGKTGNVLLAVLLAVVTVLALFPGCSDAATITVHTDRNPVALQESFQLIFEATGNVDDEPDFSPLEQDFQVLSTGTSTSMSIVNTQISRTKQWRLTLLPVNVGNLVIPAISFGKDKSPQTALTVIHAVTGRSGVDAPDVFIEVEATPGTAYVQGEVIYTVKLYRAVTTSMKPCPNRTSARGARSLSRWMRTGVTIPLSRAGVTAFLKEVTGSIPRSAATC